MQTMRILQIAHDHPDWTPGGSEILARDLARALAARPGVAARLLVAATGLHRPEAAPGALGALGPDLVLRTGAYDRFAMARLDGLAWLDALDRALAAVRPQIVHLHALDRLGAELVPAIRRRAPRARIVMTLHDYALICPNDGLMLTRPEGARCRAAAPDACRRCFPEQSAARHALRRAWLLALLAGVDRFIAPSRFLRDRFVDWGLEPGRIRVLPNAVRAPDTPPEPEPAAPARRRKAPRGRFAFFGALARHKGPLTLLGAAALLKAEGAPVSVTLHGGLGWADDGFRAEFAAALAAAAPLAAQAGPYAPGEAAALMRRADWIVIPSLWWENAPLVLAEARVAGRPVIVSGVGGLAEAVAHGVDGLHVAPGEPAALAATLRAATDPDLWARLAAASRPADHAAFVDAHLHLYHGLLDRVPA
jgi:glycosyltransferase involved in cell wall biosynthesis